MTRKRQPSEDGCLSTNITPKRNSTTARRWLALAEFPKFITDLFPERPLRIEQIFLLGLHFFQDCFAVFGRGVLELIDHRLTVGDHLVTLSFDPVDQLLRARRRRRRGRRFRGSTHARAGQQKDGGEEGLEV